MVKFFIGNACDIWRKPILTISTPRLETEQLQGNLKLGRFEWSCMLASIMDVTMCVIAFCGLSMGVMRSILKIMIVVSSEVLIRSEELTAVKVAWMPRLRVGKNMIAYYPAPTR
jgi:hypothetical protein